jgi:hypothetical protein
MKKPLIKTQNAINEDPHKLSSAAPEENKDIYPVVNERLKGAVIWLGLCFVLMVFIVQYFSGYS